MVPPDDTDDEAARIHAAQDTDAKLDRLAQSFVDRARRGESPSIEEYAASHPDLADDIGKLFPILAVVEGLKDLEGPLPSPGPKNTAARIASSAPLPKRVGDWTIVREIGRGGMGSVHEGRGKAGGASVAIKVVHPYLLRSPEYVVRFLREAEAGLRIQHPNVVHAIETGVVEVGDDDVPYLVLEYVEGQNLRALLDEVEVVPERLCRHVAHRLAGALAAIHGTGLVHRDVKPENVVITAVETVKLMDLGVAVLQEEAGRISQTGQFVGSLLYAAPEQLLGEGPDPRWDLYALGILLYELSTGRHPARALGARWLDRHDPVRRPMSPRDVNPNISHFFDVLVRTLLAPEPSERFTSALEVKAILEGGEESAWWRERSAQGDADLAPLRELDRTARFVGRAAEWDQLDRVLGDVRNGRGRVVLLLGEAGIGKTRFVGEWLAAGMEGTNAVQALVVPHGPGVVGGDEGGLIAALLAHLGPANVENRLAELFSSRAALVEPLAHHLRGSRLPTGTVALEPAAADSAYVQLLAALSRERPLVMVLEDLHFATEEARSRFLLFSRALSREPILVVGTTRTAPDPTWAADLDRLPHAERMHLEGLDPAACRALVQEEAVTCPQLVARASQLAERADRNPFLLLEFIRECMHRLPECDEKVSFEEMIPPSIRGFLTGRLAALEAEDHELLEAAACCGYEFDPVLVATATGTGRIAALKRFGRLDRRHGLLRAAGRRYVFQHHLVQEVLYGEIHTALRETYHASLGEALEHETTVPGGGARALALSTHFLEGGVPERARPHLRAALHHLGKELLEPHRAADLARRALDVPDLLVDEDRAFALFLVISELNASTRYEEASALVDQALDLARACDASGLQIDLLALRGSNAEGLGVRETMHEAFRAAVTMARDVDDPAREAYVLGVWGVHLQDEYRTDEAEACFRRGFELIRDQDDPLREGRLLTNLARIEVHRENFEEGQRLLEQALTLSHRAGDLETEALIQMTLGQQAARESRLADAIVHGRSSIELSRRQGRWNVELGLANLSYVLTSLGRYDESHQAVTEAISLAQQGRNRFRHALARLNRGHLRVCLGDVALALDDFRYAVTEGRDLQLPDLHLTAARALARTLGICGRIEEAEDVITEVETCQGAGRREKRTRTLLLDLAGRYEEAVIRWAEAIKQMRPGTSAAAETRLAYGRDQYRLGRPTDAVSPLQEALAHARASGEVAMVVLAEVHLAAIGHGDVLAARVSLEQHEAEIPVLAQLEAHLVLWETTADPAHLVAARAALARLRKGVPAEDRKAMVANVDLCRRAAEAETPGL